MKAQVGVRAPLEAHLWVRVLKAHQRRGRVAAAVAAQGTSSLNAFDASRTGQRWDEAHMRAVIIGESVCIPAIAEGVVGYWGNLTVDQFVVNYTTLHPSLHVGEIGVLAGLQGVSL